RLVPLWFLYERTGSEMPRLLEAGFAGGPTASFTYEEGSRHRLLSVADAGWAGRVRQVLAELPILIADGHHRYETALAYAEEVGGSRESSSRFTLALLTDLADPGLQVLPTHRVMKAGVAITGGE